MLGRHENRNALEPPPIANSDPEAVEVLRVWASPGHAQQVALRVTWKDPGAWGLLLVDVAEHAAKAYGNEGVNPEAVLARIRALFEAEMSSPTGEPQEIAHH